MTGFVNGFADDVIFAGLDVGDDDGIFEFIFQVVLHAVAHGNRIGDFQALNLEFAFQPGAVNVSVVVADFVPGTGGAYD